MSSTEWLREAIEKDGKGYFSESNTFVEDDARMFIAYFSMFISVALSVFMFVTLVNEWPFKDGQEIKRKVNIKELGETMKPNRHFNYMKELKKKKKKKKKSKPVEEKEEKSGLVDGDLPGKLRKDEKDNAKMKAGNGADAGAVPGSEAAQNQLNGPSAPPGTSAFDTQGTDVSVADISHKGG